MSKKEDLKIKPIIRWAGGKTQLIRALIERSPADFNDYYEPFFGSGALFFALNPSQSSHINDINRTLMNVYRGVKSNPKELTDCLELLQVEYNGLSEVEQSEYYYLKRERFNSLDHDEFERAALFVFLNKTGYNGMYRESSAGKYNIPFGRRKKVTLVNNGDLLEISKRLKHTNIYDGDYTKVLDMAKSGDFIYLDPPYHPVTKTASFTSYHKDDFGEKDQIKLRDLVISLDKKGCKVMMSNSDADIIKELYKDFQIHEVLANRFINCKGDSRGKVTELIITNY